MKRASPRLQPPGGRLSRALARAAVYTLAPTLALFALIREGGLTVELFRQDLPILVFGSAVLLLFSHRALAMKAPVLPRPALLVTALAVAAALAALAGTWLVFGGFAMTRDEVLADFDADFLARGLLIAPVPPEWAGFVGALMPKFMLPVPAGTGWLSAYLPGNAALRAAASVTLGAKWTGPILLGLSAVALYRIGRRLWPEAPGTTLAALLLLVTSAQALAMAMTPYAMTAHLAFNLLWLWAFLRDDVKGDAAAIAAGFVATGLHQLLFHPLFVFPFLVALWLSGHKRRAAVYVVAYAAIGLFWACYWQIVLAGSGAGAEQASGTGLAYLWGRLLELLGTIEAWNLALMAYNLLRFLSWQNIVLLPLALLAWPAVRQAEGIARPLAGGIVLTLLAMLLLMPWQAHGWGYRYLHGFIGSFCLLAAYGWRSLSGDSEAPARNGILAAGTAVTLLLILPVHLWQAHDFIRPYRQAYEQIVRADADLVLVEPTRLLFADDLVRNAPDLSNRPKIMAADRLSVAQIRFLCSRYRTAIFGLPHGLRAGIPMTRQAPPWPDIAQALRCARPMPLPPV